MQINSVVPFGDGLFASRLENSIDQALNDLGPLTTAIADGWTIPELARAVTSSPQVHGLVAERIRTQLAAL